MTPKEKAESIFQQMYRILWHTNADPIHCKECALVAVDEIIKSRKDDGHFDDTLSSTGSEYYTQHPMYLTYWLQVKNEINKL